MNSCGLWCSPQNQKQWKFPGRNFYNFGYTSQSCSFFRKFRKIFHSRVLKQSMPFHSSMEISENSDPNVWLNGKWLLANLRELMWSSPPIKNKTKIDQHVLTYTAFLGRLPLATRFYLELWLGNYDNSCFNLKLPTRLLDYPIYTILVPITV